MIHEVKTILNIWSSRGLTLLGKITIIKGLIISKLVHKASNLPFCLPDAFIKDLNQVMFRFIWGSKWEKIGRSQLCCEIEQRGAKMIDIKQYILALKFKWVNRLIDKSYTANWKLVENLCIGEDYFFTILRSNLRANNIIIKNLALTRFTRNTTRVLKLIVDDVQNPLADGFLWFIKLGKYHNKPLLIEEFLNAGIFDYDQVLNSENEMYSYDKMAAKFELNPNNFSFIK